MIVVWLSASKAVQSMATSIFSRALTMYGTQRESNSYDYGNISIVVIRLSPELCAVSGTAPTTLER